MTSPAINELCSNKKQSSCECLVAFSFFLLYFPPDRFIATRCCLKRIFFWGATGRMPNHRKFCIGVWCQVPDPCFQQGGSTCCNDLNMVQPMHTSCLPITLLAENTAMNVLPNYTIATWDYIYRCGAFIGRPRTG